MPTLGAHDADLISCAVAKLWAQQLPLAGEAGVGIEPTSLAEWEVRTHKQ